MLYFGSILICCLALLGHLSLCLWLGNNLNALGLRRMLTKALSKPVDLFLIVAPLLALAWAIHSGWYASQSPDLQRIPWALKVYGLLTAGIAVLFLPPWLWRQFTTRPPAALVANHTVTYDLQDRSANRLDTCGLGHLYLRLPGNESLKLEVQEKVLKLPRLPAALDGLSIVHLSDLHFTGRVCKAYFQQVVQIANELKGDLVALTGDLVDKPHCIEWLPETLGRLTAPHGVYFVLGNHDLRAGADSIRRLLAEAGQVDLSGRWLKREIRGEEILLAGNELPWIRPAAEMADCPADGANRCFRILLSHTPDQIHWARRHEFDLMLAGHTHGGQICLPGLGPILAPSRYGVRYAAGTFELPPTVMHVSRGVSGLQPIRWNCPPELTKLVLRRQSNAEPLV